MGNPDRTFEQQLAVITARHLGGPVEIRDLHRLTGGAVAETWWFDALTNDSTRELILRLDRSSGDSSEIFVTKQTEAEIQMLAIAGGVPVPEVVFILDEADGIGTGYVMQRIAGETIPRKILRDEQYAGARNGMARQCGEIMARIHTLAADRIKGLKTLKNRQQLDDQYAMYTSFDEPRPVFEYAFNWLQENVPDDPSPCLVHSDFRNGNIIVGPDGIRGILDWEMAHLGDPMEDLGWICVNSWRFGNIDKPVGGFGDREDLFAGYKAAGGQVAAEKVHYWEVFGTLKWGLICRLQSLTHLTGIVRSVELAAIGRRVSETELDLLQLLT
ncbi:phosphotransferase family protein [bacterium]|nr:phosphotransferase family protein [bacterium]